MSQNVVEMECRERERVHLLHGVGQKDGAVAHGAAHLPSTALQRGEELAVDEGGFVEAQARGHVSGHAEVCVLQCDDR